MSILPIKDSFYITEPRLAVVTGATGFVGSHLVERLVAAGFRVRCLVRRSSNLQWLTPLVTQTADEEAKVEIFYAGLDDENALRIAFTDATYIFHIAGVVKAVSLEAFLAGNATTTEHVLAAAAWVQQQSGGQVLQRVVVMSSLAAVGPSVLGTPSTEEQPLRPLSDYGRSKLEQEQVVARYMAVLPITVIRAPAIYGERDTEVLVFFDLIRNGLLPLVGHGKAVLGFLYVRDLVEGIIAAAQSPKALGETYHLGSEPEEVSWQQIASAVVEVANEATSTAAQRRRLNLATVARLFGKEYVTLYLPKTLIYMVAQVVETLARWRGQPAMLTQEKANDLTADSWACSNAKARRDFGYTPRTPLREGVAAALRFKQ